MEPIFYHPALEQLRREFIDGAEGDTRFIAMDKVVPSPDTPRFIYYMPRHAGKSYLRELMGDAAQAGTIAHQLFTGEIGTIAGGITFYHDELSPMPGCAPEPKQHRIQHGPVRKGRGGKVRKW